MTLSPPHLLDPDASLESMPLEALKRYPKDLKDMGRIPVLEKFGLDQKDESLFVNATTPSDSADLVGPLQRKIQELESKNKELKRLNDELYKASVSKILDKA